MSQKDLNCFLHEFRIGPKLYKLSLSKDGGSVRIEESNRRSSFFIFYKFGAVIWISQTLEFLCKNNRIDGFKKKFNGAQFFFAN